MGRRASTGSSSDPRWSARIFPIRCSASPKAAAYSETVGCTKSSLPVARPRSTRTSRRADAAKGCRSSGKGLGLPTCALP